MKKSLFIILSLIASTRVHGVEQSFVFNRSRNIFETISSFLPGEEAVRLMSANKHLKQGVTEIGTTLGKDFYIRTIGNRVIAVRRPTTENDTTWHMANHLNTFIRRKGIKADQMDLVSRNPNEEIDPMHPHEETGLIPRDILDEMGVKKVNTMGILKMEYEQYAQYKNITINTNALRPNALWLAVSDPSPGLQNTCAEHVSLFCDNAINNLTVDKPTCDIDALTIMSDYDADINSDNGIRQVCANEKKDFFTDRKKGQLTLDNKTCAISCDVQQGNFLPSEWNQPNGKTFDCKQWTVGLGTSQDPRILIRTKDSVNAASFDPLKECDWKTELQKENVPTEHRALFIDTPPQKDMAIPRDMLDKMGVQLVVTKTPFSCDCPDRTVIIDANEDTLNISGLKAMGLIIKNHSGSQVHFGPNVECRRMMLMAQPSKDSINNSCVTVTGDLPAPRIDISSLDDEYCANTIIASEVSFKGTRYKFVDMKD